MDIYRVIGPASILIALFGALVMLGWIADIPLLKTPLPGAPSMKFATALSVLLGGIILRAFNHIVHSEKEEVSTIKIMVAGLLLFLLTFPLIVGYFLDVDTGFDFITFSSENKNPIPSLGTIVCMSLLFLLALFCSLGYSITKASRWGGLALLGVAVLAIAGYLFNTPSLYYLTTHSTGMAIHTAAVFSLMGFFFLMLGLRPHVPGTTIPLEMEGRHARGV